MLGRPSPCERPLVTDSATGRPTRGDVWRSALIERGGLLGLATLVLYVWLAPAHIVDGDNAEFSTLGLIGGTAHPSGYPLYLMWLRAMQWLPGSTPAHTAALANAMIGAGAIVMLQAACRAWGARPLAATVTAAMFAGAPIAIRIGTRAEVFGLNCLVVATVLWLAAVGGPLRGGWRALALGLVAGLGMSNHLTCTLVTPVGVLGVVRAAREGRAPVGLGLALAGLAIGVTPYLYLFLTPDTPLSWGTVRSLDDLYGMVTRRDYGGAGSFLPTDKVVPASAQLGALAGTLGRTWLWLPGALGLVTLILRTVRRADEPGDETRWAWGALAVSWLLAGPLVSLKFNIEPAGLGLYVCQRFHVLPALLLGVPVAVGLDALAPWVRRLRMTALAGTALAATLGLVVTAGLSLPHVRRMHTPAVEQYARNVLATLPPNAVLFVGQDDEYFGTSYLQWALGVRQDVTLVAWQLTPMPWYARRITARGVFQPEGSAAPIVRVVEYLLAHDRPVFIARARDAVSETLLGELPGYQLGTLIKVLPRGTPIPPLSTVLAENKQAFERFQLGYPRPGDDDEFATAIHLRYESAWQLLARKLEAAGLREDAAFARAVAAELGPVRR